MSTLDDVPPIPPEEPPPIPAEPPPLPEQPKDLGTKAKELAGSLAKRGKAAGQLIAKQAERTKLLKITLPGLCYALGKHIYAEGKFRDEFPANYQTIDSLSEQIKAVETWSSGAPGPNDFMALAKATGKSAKGSVQVKALTMKLSHDLTELGKTVFERHGEQSGPEQLAQPTVAAQARVAVLDADIGQLSQANQGQMLTPKRIAIGGVALVCIVCLLVMAAISGVGGRSSVSGGTAKTIPPASTTARNLSSIYRLEFVPA